MGGVPGAAAPVPASRAQYSVPGILHFLQHEWGRFEAERAEWEAERAELQVGSPGRGGARRDMAAPGRSPAPAAAGGARLLRGALGGCRGSGEPGGGRGSAACPGEPPRACSARGCRWGILAVSRPRPNVPAASRLSVPFLEGAVFIKTVLSQFSNINRFFFFFF